MDYVERLMKEKDELYERVGKLQAFILSDDFVELSETDKMLLDIQLATMSTYLTILHARLCREKGVKYEE